jgi:hypothetical protein
MIRSRLYYLQTQGTVERANQTFKKRLGALQAQKRLSRSTWVVLLPELALVINTTTTRALPQKRTLFEVWFGQKPHWITAKPTKDNKTDDNSETGTDSDDDSDSDSEPEDNVLSEIKVRVAAHNARLNAQMIKANNRRSKAFTNRTVATLQILLKLQLATEPSRLLV